MLRLGGAVCYIWLVIAMAMCSIGAQPSNDTNSPVLDTSGWALKRRVRYYILPASSNSSDGGGLTWIYPTGSSCPFYVGQGQRHCAGSRAGASSNGDPVMFSPLSEEETIIRESRDFSAEFSVLTFCMEPSGWKVEEAGAEKERRLIVTGLVKGYFRIERNNITGDGGYYLAWCDPTAISCPRCRSLGTVVEDGKRVLAVGGTVFSVVFKKVPCLFCH